MSKKIQLLLDSVHKAKLDILCHSYKRTALELVSEMLDEVFDNHLEDLKSRVNALEVVPSGDEGDEPTATADGQAVAAEAAQAEGA